MGKQFITKIDRFDHGMTNDLSGSDFAACRLIAHFDAFTDKHRLIPYRSTENGDGSATTNQIVNYAYNGTTIYGYGLSGASAPAAVLTRTGYSGSVWGTTNGSSNIGTENKKAADYPLFVYYKKTGKIYGAFGSRYVWSIPETGGAINATEGDLTAWTNLAQGLVHSKDDCLYVPYDNKIARNNNGSWSGTPVLTLPADLIITSICEYGNYLAIGCRSSVGKNSRVFLWDRDSSVATLAESIDWGEGALQVLEELEGYLVGVSFIGEAITGSNNFLDRMICKYYAGSQGAQKFAEFTGFSQSPALASSIYKQKVRNRILFNACVPIGTNPSTFGIWSIARSDGRFVVAVDRLVSNVSQSSSPVPYGFILLGDYVFNSYQAPTSNTFTLDKTDSTANYTISSLYESLTFNGLEHGFDSAHTKKLISVTVTYEALPTAGSVTVGYRKDEETSFTTIFTDSVDNSISHSSRVIESTGVTLPEFKEVTFQIQSTGGAVITGLRFKYEWIDNDTD